MNPDATDWKYDADRSPRSEVGILRFRKKPVVVEAVQWDGLNYDVVYALYDPDRDKEVLRASMGMLFIPTLEGSMKATPGDWIIKGVAGEVYPCKPDIFEQTYEAVACTRCR